MDPMTMAMLGSTAVGAIGGIMGSGDKSSTTKPPKYVKRAQKANYAQGDKLYNQAIATAPTDFYAEMDPLTGKGLAGIDSFASGAGANAANAVLGAGTGALGQGTTGATNAAGALYGASTTDPTMGNIVSAGKYAANPYLDSLIDASSRDVVRNLTEQVLPGIGRGASLSGNANSSRTGIAEGLALRGAQDRVGDIAAAIRGESWANGLNLAEQAREANLGGLQSAGGLYGDVAGFGLDATGQGQQMAYNNLDAQVAAGQIRQQDAQGIINGQIAQNQYGLDLLAKKNQATGLSSVNPGSTTTVAGQGPIAGAAQGALGGAATGLGLYGTYNAINNGTYGTMNPNSNFNFKI